MPRQRIVQTTCAKQLGVECKTAARAAEAWAYPREVLQTGQRSPQPPPALHPLWLELDDTFCILRSLRVLLQPHVRRRPVAEVHLVASIQLYAA